MRIILITPAAPQSRSGNRTTATRWARLLRELGHRVTVVDAWGDGDPVAGTGGGAADLMIALHAWRSADAVRHFRAQFPGRPVVVALTGTDVSEYQHSHRRTTVSTMDAADALVCLHDLVAPEIPARFTSKLVTIHQSAPPLPGPRRPRRRHLDACVIGHLREVKDPLRAALAARRLPPASRVRVTHLGKAHDDTWAARARKEMHRNPRYRWRGEVPRWAVRRELAATSVMVISSLAEGGANVISEAIVAGVPVLASRVPGNVGLLGERHEGYFPARDTGALTTLLARAEGDAAFLARLEAHSQRLAPLFRPEEERRRWQVLLEGLAGAQPATR